MSNAESSRRLNSVPPSNLIDAMSEIQEYYLLEETGKALQKEFFTMSRAMGFVNIGIKSAVIDSFIWVIGFVFVGSFVYYIQENYLREKVTQILFWQLNGSPLYWFTKMASFGRLVFSTVMCALISRYYTGTVPRMAINTLFFARIMFLLCFSLVCFIILGLIHKYLMMDSVINQLCSGIYNFNPTLAYNIYSFIHDYFRRLIFEAGITSIVSAFISSVIPFITIFYFRFAKKRKRDLGIEVR